jgi:Fe-S cluster assembly iron-binding protein IscA
MKDKITKNDIKIEFTPDAVGQLKLIIQNDYTIKDLHFRIKIDGKGCGGFDYALGFSKKLDDDMLLDIAESNLQFIMDPFTAQYGSTGVVTYLQDFANDAEGFYFENTNEKDHRGKFFKDESKLPNLS